MFFLKFKKFAQYSQELQDIRKLSDIRQEIFYEYFKTKNIGFKISAEHVSMDITSGVSIDITLGVVTNFTDENLKIYVESSLFKLKKQYEI